MGGGYLGTLAIKLTAEIDNLRERMAKGEGFVKAFAVAATSALLAVGSASIAAGLAMDDAFDGIRISTGATGEALAGLEASFERVFAKVPDSAANASSAIAQLSVRTNSSGVALENLSTQVLTLSRITKSDLNATITDSAKVFQSWGIAANQQSATLDMVLRASQQTGVGVGTLLQTMVTAGPVFRAAGYDFATSAALIGGFEKAGVNGQRAVASLTAAFRFFAKEGIDAQKGVRDTVARIRELGPGAQASALGVKVFGRSAVDMVAAIQSGRLDVEALAKSISNGSETIESAAKATDGFTETLAQLRNNVTLALEPFGTAILGTFNTALKAIMAPSRALSGILTGLARVVIAVAVAYSVHLGAALVSATKAKVAALVASRSLALAHARETAAALALARQNVTAAVAQLQLARAETAATGSAAAETAALASLSAAQRAAGIAAAQHAAAQTAVSISARIATASVSAFKAVLAFFGGPLGLAIAAVLTAVSLGFFNAGKRAREAAAEARQAAEDFRAAIATMDEASFASAAALTRQNYRTQGDLIARQQQSIAQTQAMVDQLRRSEPTGSGYGAAKGAQQSSQAIRDAEAGLRREQANLALLQRNMAGYAANVRSVREQEAALARQRAAMPDVDTDGPGRLPWEGDSDGEKWWQQLASRAQNIRSIFEALRTQHADTTVAGNALANALLEMQDRVAGLGNAVTGELAEARSTLLKLISDLQSIDGLGFAVRMEVPGAALTSAGANLGRVSAPLQASAERGVAAAAQDEYWKIEEMRQVQRQNAARAELGTLYTFGDMAKAVAEAGERAREVWRGVTDNLPSQLAVFFEAFGALRDSRAARKASGDDPGNIRFSGVAGDFINSLSDLTAGLRTRAAELLKAAGDALRPLSRGIKEIMDRIVPVQVTGLPPAVAASSLVAMMTMADTLSRVLQPAFDALLVPLAMLAEAFGPVLVSLVQAAFPVIKLLTIGLTYLAQVIGNVGGAIFKVIGETVAAIGDLISRIPGLGQEGQAIERFGRGLVGTSNELFELARSMPGLRDELRAMEWADAMDRVADGANRASRAMVNMVEGFKVAQHRFNATSARGTRLIPPVSPTPNPANPQRPTAGNGHGETVQQVVHLYNLENLTLHAEPGEDIGHFWGRVRTYLDQQAKSQPATRATVASLPR
jgi:hypothetical protein